MAAHKYKNSWDTWGGGVGCDISSLTPPNTGASVVCAVVLVVFDEVLAIDRGADSCVLKVAARAPSSGSMSSMAAKVCLETSISSRRASVVACVL